MVFDPVGAKISKRWFEKTGGVQRKTRRGVRVTYRLNAIAMKLVDSESKSFHSLSVVILIQNHIANIPKVYSSSSHLRVQTDRHAGIQTLKTILGIEDNELHL